MSSLLRPITPADHADVLALNEAHVELLAPMDADRLVQLQEWSDLAHVIEHEGQFAGFVITFLPRSAYDSVNYRWFAQRYDDFCYLDRIVLVPEVRRLGLGTRVYDEIEQRAEPRRRMALEVNLEPPNVPSLRFHEARGYTEVDTQEALGHVVSLMVHELQAGR